MKINVIKGLVHIVVATMFSTCLALGTSTITPASSSFPLTTDMTNSSTDMSTISSTPSSLSPTVLSTGTSSQTTFSSSDTTALGTSSTSSDLNPIKDQSLSGMAFQPLVFMVQPTLEPEELSTAPESEEPSSANPGLILIPQVFPMAETTTLEPDEIATITADPEEIVSTTTKPAESTSMNSGLVVLPQVLPAIETTSDPEEMITTPLKPEVPDTTSTMWPSSSPWPSSSTWSGEDEEYESSRKEQNGITSLPIATVGGIVVGCAVLVSAAIIAIALKMFGGAASAAAGGTVASVNVASQGPKNTAWAKPHPSNPKHGAPQYTHHGQQQNGMPNKHADSYTVDFY